MKDNIELITEISNLKDAKQKTQAMLQQLKAKRNKQDKEETVTTDQPQLSAEQEQEMVAVLKREIEMKRRYISQMQSTLQSKFAQAQELAEQFDEAMNGTK